MTAGLILGALALWFVGGTAAAVLIGKAISLAEREQEAARGHVPADCRWFE